MDEGPVEVLDSRIAFDCGWYRVRQDQVRWPDGSPGVYNVIEAPASVFVVPVTTAGDILLIHHYRYTTRSWVWEVPAGAIEPGQSPDDAVRKEMQEEVGAIGGELRCFGRFFTEDGRSNGASYLYAALGVEVGENDLESAEILTIHPTPLAQVLEMVHTNQIEDATSALTILLAQNTIEQWLTANSQ